MNPMSSGGGRNTAKDFFPKGFLRASCGYRLSRLSSDPGDSPASPVGTAGKNHALRCPFAECNWTDLSAKGGLSIVHGSDRREFA